MSIMGTGIYGAAPRWTRIGAIMVVCFWYDALAADQLPRQIVGGWCLTSELPGKTYAYRRCKNGNYDIIVRWDGFDAQETSCELNTIKRQGAAWLAVKPQEVIPGQTESADRWLACEANMRPVPVVAMEPSGQRGISLL